MMLRLTHTTEHHQPPEMADPQLTNTTAPGKLQMWTLGSYDDDVSVTELDQLSDHQVCVIVVLLLW